MSVSRVVFGSLITAIVVTTMGCRVSVETKSRFVEPNVVREDTAQWTGQPIVIKIDGVGASVNGGVNVEANPQATKVTANARMLAMAFASEKPSADQSIIEAKDTFKITNTADQILIECHHGGAHGSSEAGTSGCELVNLVIPAGTAEKPLVLDVHGGNGTMTLQLRNAVLSNLGVNNASSDISAEIPNSIGANVSLVSDGGDIAVTLPSSWAAEEVILIADADKIVNPFSDAKLGAGAGGRGAAGAGLKSLKVTSKAPVISSGIITLR
jgi:hypothetical protein